VGSQAVTTEGERAMGYASNKDRVLLASNEDIETVVEDEGYASYANLVTDLLGQVRDAGGQLCEFKELLTKSVDEIDEEAAERIIKGIAQKVPPAPAPAGSLPRRSPPVPALPPQLPQVAWQERNRTPPRPVHNAPLTLDDLTRVSNEACEAAAPFRDEDLVLMLGATGSGKTTTMHFLHEHDLTYGQRCDGLDSTVIELADKRLRDSHPIGHGGRSMTSTAIGREASFMPAGAHGGKPRMVDLPGDLDTRTTERTTVLRNALIKGQVMRNARSVRSVLLLQFSQLTAARGAQLDDALGEILKAFVDLEKHLGSIATLVCPVSTGEDLDRWVDASELELIQKVLRPINEIAFGERNRTCQTMMTHVLHQLQEAASFRRDTGGEPKTNLNKGLRAYVILPVLHDVQHHRRRIQELISNTPAVQDPSAAFHIVLPRTLELAIRDELSTLGDDVKRLLDSADEDDLAKVERVSAEVIGVCDALRVIDLNQHTRRVVDGGGGVLSMLHSEWGTKAEQLCRAVRDANGEDEVGVCLRRLTLLHECVLSPLARKTQDGGVWKSPTPTFQDVKARCGREVEKLLDGLTMGPGADVDAVVARLGVCRRIEAQVLGQARQVEFFCTDFVRCTAAELDKLAVQPGDADTGAMMHCAAVFRTLEMAGLFGEKLGEAYSAGAELAAKHADTQARLFQELRKLRERVMHELSSVGDSPGGVSETAVCLKLLRVYSEEPVTARALGKSPEEIQESIDLSENNVSEIAMEAGELYEDVSQEHQAQRLAKQFLFHEVLVTAGDAKLAKGARQNRIKVGKEIHSLLRELETEFTHSMNEHIEDVRAACSKAACSRLHTGRLDDDNLRRADSSGLFHSKQDGIERAEGVLRSIVHLSLVDEKLPGQPCSEQLRVLMARLTTHLEKCIKVSANASWPLRPAVSRCLPSTEGVCKMLHAIVEFARTHGTAQAVCDQLSLVAAEAQQTVHEVFENINGFIKSSVFPSHCVGPDKQEIRDWPFQFKLALEALHALSALSPEVGQHKIEQLTKVQDDYIHTLTQYAEASKSLAELCSLVMGKAIPMLSGTQKAEECAQRLIREMSHRMKDLLVSAEGLNAFSSPGDLHKLYVELVAIICAVQSGQRVKGRSPATLDLEVGGEQLQQLLQLRTKVEGQIGQHVRSFMKRLDTPPHDKEFGKCMLDCVRDIQHILPEHQGEAWRMLDCYVYSAIKEFRAMLETEVPAAVPMGKQLKFFFLKTGSEEWHGDKAKNEWHSLISGFVLPCIKRVEIEVSDRQTYALEAQTRISEHWELAEVFGNTVDLKKALKLRWPRGLPSEAEGKAKGKGKGKRKDKGEDGGEAGPVRSGDRKKEALIGLAAFYFAEGNGNWHTSRHTDIQQEWNKFATFVRDSVADFFQSLRAGLSRSFPNFRELSQNIVDAESVLEVLDRGRQTDPNKIFDQFVSEWDDKLKALKAGGPMQEERDLVQANIGQANSHHPYRLHAWLREMTVHLSDLSPAGIKQVGHSALLIFNELSNTYKYASGDQATKFSCVSSAIASVEVMKEIVSMNTDCRVCHNFLNLNKQVNHFAERHKAECDSIINTYLQTLKRDLSDSKLTDDVFRRIAVIGSNPSLAEDLRKLIRKFNANLRERIEHAKKSIAKAAINQVNLDQLREVCATFRGMTEEQFRLLGRGGVEIQEGLTRDSRPPPDLNEIRTGILWGLKEMLQQEKKEITQEPSEVVHFYRLQKQYFAQLREFVEALPEEALTADVLRAELGGLKQTAQAAWLRMQQEGWEAAHNTGAAREFQHAVSRLKVFASELGGSCTGELAADQEFAALAEKAAIKDAEEWLSTTAAQVTRQEDVHEVASGLVAMRRAALLAPTLHGSAVQSIRRVLGSVVQRWPRKKKNHLMTVMQGHPDNEAAASICAENPAYLPDMAQVQWTSRLAGGKSVKEIVQELKCEPPLDGRDRKRLKSLLEEHEQYFASRLKEAMSRRFGESRDSLLTEVRGLAEEAKRTMAADAVARVVSCICVIFSVFSTLQGDIEDPGEIEQDLEKAVKPHTVQVMTIYRMLGVEMSDTMWDTLGANMMGLMGFRATVDKPRRRNHMAQILTGAGKSITLCIAAATFALQGMGADIVCYSEYLTRRDEEKMRRFLSFMDIKEDMVRYFTFDSLCESRLQGVGRVAKDLIENRTVDVAQVQCIEPNKGFEGSRVLLIDEVDVFFTKRFCGATYNAGFTLRSKQISAFARAVFARRGQSFNPTTLDEFVEVLNCYSPSVHQLLTAVATQCVEGVRVFAERSYRLNRTEKPGVIEYRCGDQYESVVRPNETMFAYLASDQLTDDEQDAKVGLDCPFCHFSFAEIPRWYRCVLGVSGTVECMSDTERRFLRDMYDVNTYSYAPSVFKNSVLNGGRHDAMQLRHDTFTTFHKTEEHWVAAIEMRAMRARSHQAVLVFFKNQAHLDLVRGKSALMSNCQTLSELTPKSERPGIITAAVQKGQVTLCTRSYGRGVDFLSLDESTIVLCIATFLSSTRSEQVQIIGRTARQGQRGEFYMELCNYHLMQKFFPDEVKAAGDSGAEAAIAAVENVVERLKSSPPDRQAIRWDLEQRQAVKSTSKSKGREMRLKSAGQQDKKSWQLVRLLAEREKDAEEKKKAVVKSVTDSCARPTHYVVLLDASGSMSSDWPLLIRAYEGFVAQLQAEATASVFVFSCEATEVPITPEVEGAPRSLPKSLPKWKELPRGMRGTTNYGDAFAKVKQVMEDEGYSQYAKSIVFFTDGYPNTDSDHEKICDGILDKHLDDIQSFFCIYFSQDRNRRGAAPAVMNLQQQFSQRQIPTEVQTPHDKVELMKSMKQAAHSVQMHVHA